MRAWAGARTAGNTHAYRHTTTHAQDCDERRRWQLDLHVGVQLEVLVVVMLTRERRVLADAEAGCCAALASALASLPSGELQIVAAGSK
jgi:hypothetical protein